MACERCIETLQRLVDVQERQIAELRIENRNLRADLNFERKEALHEKEHNMLGLSRGWTFDSKA